MGLPLRSLAPEANVCFMVWIPRGPNRIQGCGAMYRASWRAPLGSENIRRTDSRRLDRRTPIQGRRGGQGWGHGCGFLILDKDRIAQIPIFRKSISSSAGRLPSHAASARLTRRSGRRLTPFRASDLAWGNWAGELSPRRLLASRPRSGDCSSLGRRDCRPRSQGRSFAL